MKSDSENYRVSGSARLEKSKAKHCLFTKGLQVSSKFSAESLHKNKISVV
ncbi:hypothetical Protein YC6258_04113 [Gynuella sunshinyii YC6258]|uniref:Uncharacterized protein n=1 Tax=Gynuella sunshinyii YC6258 TaxID=1445510 RepID=A0A0C5W0D9_9GAMM|nr:hypothetical Protein YC6258_04113 [Gynuella sunshinyii YC6258]